ncbi:undecaprenyl/decaprenyl-phosphate alpha-N-acetylglucosaminyl 1-phosphate transferase [Candidatus Daviesbacteria bacterium]|nr:undecaprenyl/decaprenyl-phosphate alpha-N-acetylglucosaminyl 1-phosphate transferase [Candidatus Daviesbacteria bacterium]
MEVLFAVLISFLITVAATPVVIHFAKRYGLVDNPKLRPHPAHIHKTIIPRAGGLPVFIGIFVATIFFIPLTKQITGILASLTILLMVGLADDKFRDLSPYARLTGQLLAALIVVGSGIGISFITNPFGGILQLDPLNLSINFFNISWTLYLADLLAVLWIVWVMNMINWSKGVDGQMPSIALIASLILGYLSFKFFLEGDISQLTSAKLAFITAGASAGLLIFNWYPSKILPAFSGSTILGFLIAVLAILSGAKLATAGLVLLVPATDFIYTFWRRILQGKSPVWGDRGHLHHKLLDLGLNHQQISLFYIIGSAILGVAAITLNSKGKLFAAILVGAVVLGTILWLNFFGGLSKRQGQDSG